MYWFPSLYKKWALLHETVDLFHWKVWVLLMPAVILYCATSILHVPHRHTPDLIDMVVPVLHLTWSCHLYVGYVQHNAAFSMYLDHGPRLVTRFFVQISSKIVNSVFFCPKCYVQNKFLVSLSNSNRHSNLVIAPRASNSTDVDWKFLWHWPVCIADRISNNYDSTMNNNYSWYLLRQLPHHHQQLL